MLLVQALVAIGMRDASVAMKSCFSFNPMFQHSLSRVLYLEHRLISLDLKAYLEIFFSTAMLQRIDVGTPSQLLSRKPFRSAACGQSGGLIIGGFPVNWGGTSTNQPCQHATAMTAAKYACSMHGQHVPHTS